MELSVDQKGSVTVLGIDGKLDGSNFKELIDKAQELIDGGVKNILLDMGKCSFMSSAGLVSLHSIALMLRGEEPPDPEHGWGAYRSIGQNKEGGGKQQHLKLLNAPDFVQKVLETTGMIEFFESFSDRNEALASF